MIAALIAAAVTLMLMLVFGLARAAGDADRDMGLK